MSWLGNLRGMGGRETWDGGAIIARGWGPARVVMGATTFSGRWGGGCAAAMRLAGGQRRGCARRSRDVVAARLAGGGRSHGEGGGRSP
jgi:hypothetical protein